MEVPNHELLSKISEEPSQSGDSSKTLSVGGSQMAKMDVQLTQNSQQSEDPFAPYEAEISPHRQQNLNQGANDSINGSTETEDTHLSDLSPSKGLNLEKQKKSIGKQDAERTESETQFIATELKIQKKRIQDQLKDNQVDYFAKEAELEKNKKKYCWSTTKYWFRWFISHARTERALRTVLFFIPALLFSYYNVVTDTNFSYTCALFYALMSALIPPLISGTSIVVMMAFYSGLIGCAYATLAWTVGLVTTWSLSSRDAMFLTYIPLIALVAPLKVGKATAITGMSALMVVYSSELPFYMTFKYIADGINLHIPLQGILEKIQGIDTSKLPLPLPPVLPIPGVVLPVDTYSILIEAFKTALMSSVMSGTPIKANIKLSAEIFSILDKDFKLIGPVDTDLSLGQQGLDIHIPPASWMIRVAWEGVGRLAVVKGILIYGSMAMALFIVSLLIAPQRYSRSWLRRRIAAITREAGELLQLAGESIGLVDEYKHPPNTMLVSESFSEDKEVIGALAEGFAKTDVVRSQREEFRIVVDTISVEDSPFQQSGASSVSALGTSAPSKTSVSKITERSSLNSLKGINQQEKTKNSPSIDKIASSVERQKMGWVDIDKPEKEQPVKISRETSQTRSYTTKAKLDEFDYHTLRDYSKDKTGLNESINECVSEAMESLNDLTPLIAVSAMEPSISNPGIFVCYFLKWPPVFDSLRRCYVHCGAFWDLVKARQDSVIDRSQSQPKRKLVPSILTSLGIEKSKTEKIEKNKLDDLNRTQSGNNSDSLTLCESNTLKDWPTLPTKDEELLGIHTELLKKIIVPARHTANMTIECFEAMADLIGLRPVSRGAQLMTTKHLREELHHRMHKLIAMRDELTTETEIMKLFNSSSKMKDWRIAVSSHAALLEFNQIVVEAPLQLAIAIDHLLVAQSTIKVVQGLCLNIVGWCLPLLAITITILRNFFHMLMPWRWKWKMYHHRYLGTGQPWYRNSDVLFCYRWSIGVLSLMCLVMYWDNFRTWSVSGEHPKKGSTHTLEEVLASPMTAKVAAWSSLGFLTTIFMTAEGTVHRAGLRLMGVTFGTLSGFFCLLIFGSKCIAGHIAWLSITVFVSVWIGGNPASALLGYHPSWGYSAQLFTYQETIIVVEAFHSVQTRNELVASRFTGQLIGISTACLVSLLLAPDQANVTIQQCIVQGLHCSTQSVIAIAESLMLSAYVVDGSPCVSEPRLWDEPEPKRSLLGRLIHSFRKSITAKLAPQKIQVTSIENEDRTTLLQNKRKLFVSRSNKYHQDAKDAVEKITVHLRDATIFKELPVCGLDQRWKDATLALQLMMLHREAFADLASLPTLPSTGGNAQTEFANLLKALNNLSGIVCDNLTKGISGWYPGYNLDLIINIFCYIPPLRKWQRQMRSRRTAELLENMKKATDDLNSALDELGKTYSEVLASAGRTTTAALAQILPKESPSHPTDGMDGKLRMTREMWLWLVTTHCLLRYSTDLRVLVEAVTKNYESYEVSKKEEQNIEGTKDKHNSDTVELRSTEL